MNYILPTVNLFKKYLFLVPAITLASCSGSKNNASTTTPGSIPQKHEVGATVLPDYIAPVKAPFKMPVFKKPVFPSLTINITDVGAKQQVLSTSQIQAAIDDVSKRGGGMVLVPAGIWKTGRISLKSNVNLHIAQGAELRFSGAVEDYRPAVFTRHEGVEVMSLGACIYAYGQENIAITGKGTLIGPEQGGSVRKQVMKTDVVEKFVSADIPVAKRIYEGYNGEEIFLPMFISPTNCKNVYIEGVTLEKTAFWNIVPVYCDGVIIRGVTVNSVGIPRGDGIDIESSKNVLIEYCTLNNGDDCFTMKSGRGEDGMRVNRATENIVVRYCLAQQGHGAITCGSETAGMIRNLYVHDCVFDNTGVGIRFKTRRPRGGGGDNLIYERIRMNLNGTAFNWDMLGGKMYVGELANRLPIREINSLTPSYTNIIARNIIIEKSSQFIKVTGIPETPMTNFLLENADVKSKSLMSIQDARNMTLRNVNIESQDSLIRVLDGRNIKFENVKFTVPGGGVVTNITGPASDSIRFINTTPAKPLGWGENSWYKK